jgi:L-fuconolactonase
MHDDVVDAHHHLWVRARTPQPWIDRHTKSRIDADFTPAELPAREHGVAATVVVQSADSWDESRELLRVAASAEGRAAGISGVVAWADLLAPDLADRLAALRDGPGGDRLVGIRTQVQAQPATYLDRDDVRRGIATVGAAGLAFDLVVLPEHLPSAARLAHDLPDVRLVLDHLGKPDLTATVGDVDTLADWRNDLTALAAAENVTAKISGLVTEARWDAWTLADLWPAVDHALTAFGPDRLMFGSDWPVCLLATDYGDWLATARALLADLAPAERAAVGAGTARRTYALKEIA